MDVRPRPPVDWIALNLLPGMGPIALRAALAHFGDPLQQVGANEHRHGFLVQTLLQQEVTGRLGTVLVLHSLGHLQGAPQLPLRELGTP